MAKKTYNELVNEVKDVFVKGLQEDGLKWLASWSPKYESINGKSNAHYRGINHLRLSFDGFSDTRYFTFKQATEKGYKVKKGSKSQVVCKFAYWDRENKVELSQKDYDPKNPEHSMFIKTYLVFNAEQLDGIELQDGVKQCNFDTRIIENIAKNMNIEVVWGSPYSAPCYVPAEDKIYMPSKKLFKSEKLMYRTALHELGHATGHVSRLNREYKSYAFEELVAEMTSALVCSYLGVQNTADDRNKAYVNSWIKMLNDKPQKLIDAFKLAENAADYIIKASSLEMDAVVETAPVTTQKVEKVKATKTTGKATTRKATKKSTNKTKKASNTVMTSFVRDGVEFVKFELTKDDNNKAVVEMPLSYYLNMKKTELNRFKKAWGIA